MPKKPEISDIVDSILGEIIEIQEEASIVPQSAACAESGFRPLTDKEKREFVASLDDKGRGLLAELAVKNPLQKPARALKSPIAPSPDAE